MKTRSRMLALKLLRTMGERDAALGISPARYTKSYLAGYSQMYVTMTRQTALSEQQEAF